MLSRAGSAWITGARLMRNWSESGPRCAHPDVLLARCEVYMKAEKWDWVITVTQTLVNVAPDKPRGWILRSYGLHKLKRTERLSICCCPSGRNSQKNGIIRITSSPNVRNSGGWNSPGNGSRKLWLSDEKSARAAAILDPDLKPLWDSLSRTIWKRCE